MNLQAARNGGLFYRFYAFMLSDICFVIIAVFFRAVAEKPD